MSKKRRKRGTAEKVIFSICAVGAVTVIALSALLLKPVYQDMRSSLEGKKQEEETLRITEKKETEWIRELETEQETEYITETAETEDAQTPSFSVTIDNPDISSVTGTEQQEPRLTVAIDPGHQGSWVNMSEKEPLGPGSSEMKAKASTGTQGRYSGLTEYELNLDISLQLRDELKKRGYRVVMTREDNDKAISNAERARMAYEEGGDIYVRIHANGSDDGSVNGALAMVPSPSNPFVSALAADSMDLGQSILDAYCSAASFRNLGVQYYDNMTGINWSQIPVMILEMGFMTNQSDDTRMADKNTQIQMVKGIADGIDHYFAQKGMTTADSPYEEIDLFADDWDMDWEGQINVDACLEILGESYLYQAMDQGEQWSVSLIDLESGAQGDLNGDRKMMSASVIKVFLMAAVYDRVCYPSTPERYISYPESYAGELRQQITDMISVSDNYAANTILTNLGHGDAREGMRVVNQFCEENGYTGTSFGRKFLESNPDGDNYTTANDCAKLLASIYDGTCVNKEASAKMYDFLKQQTRRWKIPAGLDGTGAKTANKTGELYGEYNSFVENDIAIVESAAGPDFVFCVLSAGLRDNESAQNMISRMSGTVYDVLMDQ